MAGNDLAWIPENREPYVFNSEYVEVHPRVWEAVMSTLAIACAQSEGLEIVGDERTGELRDCLLEKNLEDNYETWLEIDQKAYERPRVPTGEELMDFILGFKLDLSTLTVANLHDIAAEREPIDQLIKALREQATRIPTMDKGNERDEYFIEGANEIMDKWKGGLSRTTCLISHARLKPTIGCIRRFFRSGRLNHDRHARFNTRLLYR